MRWQQVAAFTPKGEGKAGCPPHTQPRVSPCGGIGRRARLKIEFRKERWFDSGQEHHFEMKPKPIWFEHGCDKKVRLMLYFGMAPYISKISDADEAWKYSLPTAANKEGHLLVSQIPKHEIYWAEYGNPQGEPVIFLHGGPGGACGEKDARFFDPKRYRIILFDQRGCGRSKPNVAHDPKGGLADNDTPHLIEDIQKLRDTLRIKEKMHVFGGSWGSTLALAYAIEHPENLQSLALRGIFPVRKVDLDYFYQGNAATHHENPHDTKLAGAYLFFPEAWKEFVEITPIEKRDDMIKAYAEIFNKDPQSDEERELQLRAVKAWTKWEGVTSFISQKPEDLGKFGDADFAKAFARIENHYFMNGCFLGGKSGEAWRDNNYLLENVSKISHIPIRLVQGQYDQVCPRFGADALVDALKKAGAQDLEYQITAAGHSRHERENVAAQTAFMDTMPFMDRANKLPGRSDTGRKHE
jgi:proline iminopeptidase